MSTVGNAVNNSPYLSNYAYGTSATGGPTTGAGQFIEGMGGTAGVIGVTGTVAAGIFGMATARSSQRAAQKNINRYNDKLESLEANRQAIIDPYAGITNLAGMITDRSNMMHNAYANLSVATQAAEMQAEQADISLANTLDTLRATGSGSGGATALAQAALQSKKEISSNIEQQEVANEKLRAGGEQNLEQRIIAEKQRIEGLTMSEASKVQAARAQGKAFVFNATETRQQAQLDRQQALLDNAMMQESQGGADAMQAMMGMVTGIASIASDRRLKKNIKLIGKSPNGLNIYAFEYINKLFGKGRFQGVMSDEIPNEAIIKFKDGYDRVDYSKLDVEFKNI